MSRVPTDYRRSTDQINWKCAAGLPRLTYARMSFGLPAAAGQP